MDKNLILKNTEQYVRQTLQDEGSGHDWWHVYRVWKNAIHIGQGEDADLFVVQIAALLHDIADWKSHGGDDSVGPRIAREWLEGQQVDEGIIIHVCDIIKNMSFKGADVESQVRTKEGLVVQDADRLDAMGAIGIARAFTYGGHVNREIYNPNLKPKRHSSFTDYYLDNSSSINHFYEKLLLLKDRMNTQAARRIAQKRHDFMEQYLQQFFAEWEGRDS